MDYRQMTAPCGLDCFNCPTYLANEDKELRKTIAEKWGIPPDKAICQGCRNEKGSIGILKTLEIDVPCNVYKCIQEKGHDFCFECPEFPCDHLQPYADKASEVPHNTKVFQLCLIKRVGLDRWAKEKAKKARDTYFEGEWKI